MKKHDLTGLKFGRWTVIKRCDDYIHPNGWKRRRWLCRCSCGNEKIVLEPSLISGLSKSCGCLQKEIAKKNISGNDYSKKNLTGMVFGKLTVVNKTGNIAPNGCVEYECLCSCGNQKITSGKHLTDGMITSCGCSRRENGIKMAAANDIGMLGCYKNTKINNLISKTSSNNTSGCKGVWQRKGNGKWIAEIKLRGKKHYLGCYDYKEDAIKARKRAEEELFKPIIEEYQERKCD